MKLENEPKVLGINYHGNFVIVSWDGVFFITGLNNDHIIVTGYWYSTAEKVEIFFGKIPERIADDAIKKVKKYRREGGEELEELIEYNRTQTCPELQEAEARYMKLSRLNKRAKMKLTRNMNREAWAQPHMEAIEKTMV